MKSNTEALPYQVDGFGDGDGDGDDGGGGLTKFVQETYVLQFFSSFHYFLFSAN